MPLQRVNSVPQISFPFFGFGNHQRDDFRSEPARFAGLVASEVQRAFQHIANRHPGDLQPLGAIIGAHSRRGYQGETCGQLSNRRFR